MARMSAFERPIKISLSRSSFVPAPLRALSKHQTSCCRGPRMIERRQSSKYPLTSFLTSFSRSRPCRCRKVSLIAGISSGDSFAKTLISAASSVPNPFMAFRHSSAWRDISTRATWPGTYPGEGDVGTV